MIWQEVDAVSETDHDELPFGMNDMLESNYPDNLMLHAFLMDDDLRLLLSRLTKQVFEKPKTGEGVFDPNFEIIW